MTTTTTKLTWTRERPGRYITQDSDGTRWVIDQRTASAWTIIEFRPGESYGDDTTVPEASSLKDAKFYVEQERCDRADPERLARREARIRRLREKRNRR